MHIYIYIYIYMSKFTKKYHCHGEAIYLYEPYVCSVTSESSQSSSRRVSSYADSLALLNN